MMLDRTRYDPPSRRRRGPPPGYEYLRGVRWSRLTDTEVEIVCAFADGVREIMLNELELLRLGTVDHIQAICVALRELRYCR
jgi:hypothetical protein